MINFAIAGCGRVAAVHAEAIRQAQGARLLAVCDINEECLYPFAQNYGAESAFTDFRAMINDPAIDVVNICTPNALHAEMAIQAMEKGKHVMIEKPMALSVSDADRIIETAKNTMSKRRSFIKTGSMKRSRRQEKHWKRASLEKWPMVRPISAGVGARSITSRIHGVERPP